jgi:hypothetical protein
MSRTRMPPLGASASAGDSSVSSPSNSHLTRARPPHQARAPLLTGLPSPTSSPHHGKGGATCVAPAAEVAPTCSPRLTPPTPTAARGLSPCVAEGTALFNHAYALQALAIQVRRGNPPHWHRLCLAVHREHGVSHAASATHRGGEAITGGNRHTGIAASSMVSATHSGCCAVQKHLSIGAKAHSGTQV